MTNITTTSLTAANVGEYYTYQLTAASVGSAPYWTYDGYLPDGISISHEGIIQGVPTQPGVFSISVTVAGVSGSATASLVLGVNTGKLDGSTRIAGPVTNLVFNSLGSEAKNYNVTIAWDLAKTQDPENQLGTIDLTNSLVTWYKVQNYGASNQTAELISSDVTQDPTYSLILPKGIYIFKVTPLSNDTESGKPVELDPSIYDVKTATISAILTGDGGLVGVTSDFTKAITDDNPTYYYKLNDSPTSADVVLVNSAEGSKAGLGVATAHGFSTAPAIFGEDDNTAYQAVAGASHYVKLDTTGAPFIASDDGSTLEFVVKPAVDTNAVVYHFRDTEINSPNEAPQHNAGIFVGPNGIGVSAFIINLGTQYYVMSKINIPGWTPDAVYHVVCLFKDNKIKVYVNGGYIFEFDETSVISQGGVVQGRNGAFVPGLSNPIEFNDGFGKRVSLTADAVTLSNNTTSSQGATYIVDSLNNPGTEDNILSHWALYDHPLTPAQILNHFNKLIGLIKDPNGPDGPNNGPVTPPKIDPVVTTTTTCEDFGTCPQPPPPTTPTKPTITTESIKHFLINKDDRSFTLNATGTKPITWSISAGKLPSGLSLNKTTGKISGKPTKLESQSVTFKATNSVGNDTKTFTIKVDKVDGPGVLPPGPDVGQIIEYIKVGDQLIVFVNGVVYSITTLSEADIATYFSPSNGINNWYDTNNPQPGVIVSPLNPYDESSWLYVDVTFRETKGIGTPYDRGYTISSNSVVIGRDDLVQVSQLLLEDDFVAAQYAWRGGKVSKDYYRISGRGANLLFNAGYGYMLKQALTW